MSAGRRSFRDYAETASDWLWETGPDHSFTRVSADLTARHRSRRPDGAMRCDYATDVVEEPEKWRVHRATLEAHPREPGDIGARGGRAADIEALVNFPGLSPTAH